MLRIIRKCVTLLEHGTLISLLVSSHYALPGLTTFRFGILSHCTCKTSLSRLCFLLLLYSVFDTAFKQSFEARICLIREPLSLATWPDSPFNLPTFSSDIRPFFFLLVYCLCDLLLFYAHLFCQYTTSILFFFLP